MMQGSPVTSSLFTRSFHFLFVVFLGRSSAVSVVASGSFLSCCFLMAESVGPPAPSVVMQAPLE